MNFLQKGKNDKKEVDIYMSKSFSKPNKISNKKKKALVLIQGTGAVRAGLWARSASINDNFEMGTMLP